MGGPPERRETAFWVRWTSVAGFVPGVVQDFAREMCFKYLNIFDLSTDRRGCDSRA
jgi:hypothetical protein